MKKVFHTLKNITTGEGGAVISNDKILIKKINSLKNHGFISYRKNNKQYWNNDMLYPGYNYRLTSFQAALGLSQIKNLSIFLKKRRQIARIYNKELSGLSNLILPKEQKNSLHSYHLYPLLIDFEKINKTKNSLLEFFLTKKFRLQTHYKPIHFYEYYKKKFKYKKGDFPNAEKFYSMEISLPIFHKIKNLDQLRFIKILKKYIKTIE